MAKVDIIVLTHNRLDVTERFISALFSNTKSFNLILVDNGSTDGTVDFLRDLDRQDHVFLHEFPENEGVIVGRNQGWKMAQEVVPKHKQGHLVQILDNDQFVGPGWLEQHDQILGMGYDVVGVESWKMRDDFFPVPNRYQGDYFQYVGCGGMLMRREVPEKIGMFDERFSPAYFEDPDFCFRAFEAHFKVGWNYWAKIEHEAHSTLREDESWKAKFTSSMAKFQDKWQGKVRPYWRMPPLPR